MTTWRHYDVGNVRHFVPFEVNEYHLVLDDGERQLTLLALAVLSLESPGFDYALNDLARKIDNVKEERAMMYDGFRVARTRVKP